MTSLVADVGGTNTRIALAGPDRRLAHLARYENREFASFDAVLAAFFQEHPVTDPLKSGCIAVAGPVRGDKARLTNRDWAIDTPAVASGLPTTLETPLKLVNDLVALGQALPDLKAGQVSDIVKPKTDAPNGQALVVGLGTGFNVCMVRNIVDAWPVTLGAELGHASLPVSVRNLVPDLAGEVGAGSFQTVEDVFSGHGLAQLSARLGGDGSQNGAQIVKSAGADPSGPQAQSVKLMVRMLAVFTRELVFQYLPMDGIFFAGGAARGVLGPGARQVFVDTLRMSEGMPGSLNDLISSVPVRLISDDAAALTGAARIASCG